MKSHAASILLGIAALGAAVLHYARQTPTSIQDTAAVGTESTPTAEVVAPVPERTELPPPEPAPKPESIPQHPVSERAKPIPAPAAKLVPVAARNPMDAALYWREMAATFDRERDRLEREQDPAARQNLIRSMAGFVRIDTPRAIGWAMGLDNPDERRTALEAINQLALSGIGARIEVDGTGLPKIKGTTVLSAVDATGLVQPGDYISGMVDGNGSVIGFQGRDVRQIVQLLRGKPGTEMTLQMERVPDDGSPPYSFDVPVQRSLIVVQPPD